MGTDKEILEVAPVFATFSTQSDLTETAFEHALTIYEKKFKSKPTYLIVSRENEYYGYSVLHRPFLVNGDLVSFGDLHKIRMVAVDLPVDMWFLTGPHGVFYSEGA